MTLINIEQQTERRPESAGAATERRSVPALRGSRILITGGTGSFGNRVARHLVEHDPARIIVYSRDEKKQWEMRQHLPDFDYMIGDVRDTARLRNAMRGVDIVFHAAALKQVPSCEQYPYEALLTNTIGSNNVCEAALEAGVGVLVALSTDKAVKPVNAMGMSKALMEKIVVSKNLGQSDTRFCCVRYGNVMGSRGSVIPLFRKQIDAGMPVTLTVPHMTRFLMTLDQSVDLVVHAMTNARGGEVFVRKAPATTVEDLARVMIRKYGGGRDIPLKEVGIRPGEKIDEVLVNEYEIRRATETETYFTIHPEYRIPDVDCRYEYGYEYSSANTQRLTSYEEISALLDGVGDVEFYT
jgi:UDP-N-acetylglucosamine 4,6-dehydratase/5-epimerase